MRGAGAAATAGGRARGAKDQEFEIDEEQQEARQEEKRALAGGRSGRQRGGESGERKETKNKKTIDGQRGKITEESIWRRY